MKRDEALRQRLWELVYDLLPDNEAAALKAEIAADPEVAQLYDEVKSRIDIVAATAKLQEPPIPLTKPADRSVASADRATPRRRESKSAPRQALNWCVGAAAAALVFMTAFAYFKTDSPINPRSVASSQQKLSREHIRSVMTGPAKLQPGVTNYFTVTTTSADGAPQTADVQYRLYDTATGKLKLQQVAQTESDGRLLISLPSELAAENARLEIETRSNGRKVTSLVTHLPVDHVRRATYVSSDKPLYRPGETVYFRSLTLSRFGLREDLSLPVAFEILDPAGTPIAESRQAGYTERGVGNGSFVIQPGRPGGKYTLVASSPNEAFPEARRDFFVRDYRTPRLKKQLEFTRDSYAPGDEVVADFSADRAEGGPAANAALRIAATVDQQPVVIETAEAVATAAGTYQVKFRLPAEIEKGDATLTVIADDGGTVETIAKTIPINLGKVEVAFYPEGGDLVAGLENRVYFHATDPLAKPVYIQGRIVDSKGNEIATVETADDSEGRGVFRFTPKAKEMYSLEITSPADVTSKPELPPTSDDRFLVLDAGVGVFEAGQPIELELRSTKRKPLVVSAVCRGAPVGQIETVKAGRITLPLAEEAQGVIRLTVYDYSGEQPKPIAERLVYRRPARELKISIADQNEAYSPGDKVALSLVATDESGTPQPAVFGVRVVDDALLNLADDKSPGMTTHFVLATEIENPEDLEEADFFLSNDEGAATALDLLLGTQGWRRFVEVTAGELAGAEEGNEAADAITRLVALDAESSPPLVYDNLSDVSRDYAESLVAYRTTRETNLNQLGRISFFGGVALVVVLALLTLFRVTSGAKVLLPAFTACIACLVIGGLWMSARIDAQGEVALSPFAVFGIQDEPAEVVVLRDSSESMHAADPADRWDVWERGKLGHEEFRFDGPDFGVGGMDAKGLVAFDDMIPVDGAMLAPNFAGFFAKNPARFDVPVANEMILGENDIAGFGGGGFGLGGPEGFGDGHGWVYQYQPANIELLQQRLQKAAQAGDMDGVVELAEQLQQVYAQVRFPVRQYAHQHSQRAEPGLRTDFTETVYWHPLLIADETGRASIEFDLSDSVTTFRLLADGHASGRLGSVESELFSRIPFSLEPKLPLEVNAGDRIDLPVAVNNDTKTPLPVKMSIQHNELLALDDDAERELLLQAGERTRAFYAFNVVGEIGQADVEFRGTAGALTDGVKKSIRVVPPGFPVDQSYAGLLDGPQDVALQLPEDWVAGSLEVSLRAFPSSLADLQGGLEGILREPSGCFEQTSSSNYPNVLALGYMQEHDVADPEFTRRAKELLKNGYGKLVGFECPQKGYEWFGGDPGHEALTAYGLMEFQDMSAVWDVDQEMVERTAAWLMKRRDGKGGFQRNERALDSFGGAPQDITDAYIVWALTEAKRPGIEKELQHSIRVAKDSDDPYLIALVAAAAANVDDPAAEALLDKLAGHQHDDGHLAGKNGTITRSGGISLQVETTAIAAMAWLKRDRFAAQANEAIQWITKNRQGSGGFGSTQATIMALKVLIEHAKVNRKTVDDGALVLKIDSKEVARTEFKAGEKHAIEIAEVAKLLKAGKNNLTIELTGDNKMPYVLDIAYRTRTPVSSDNCPVRLSTKLSAENISAGDTVDLAVELSNTSGKGQPMTVAIVGLPAGLEARQEKLEELKEAGAFDFYEVSARELIFYWRSLGPDVKDDAKIAFHLDVIAEIPGRYTGPASRAYLYYTAEEKHWVVPSQIEIRRE